MKRSDETKQGAADTVSHTRTQIVFHTLCAGAMWTCACCVGVKDKRWWSRVCRSAWESPGQIEPDVFFFFFSSPLIHVLFCHFLRRCMIYRSVACGRGSRCYGDLKPGWSWRWGASGVGVAHVNPGRPNALTTYTSMQ